MSLSAKPLLATAAAVGADAVLPGWVAPLAVGLIVALFQWLASRQISAYEKRLDKAEEKLEAETHERRERNHELANKIHALALDVAHLEERVKECA